MTGKARSPRAQRPLWVGTAAAACGAILALILAQPAWATDGSDPQLQLSRDGIHFAPESLSQVLAKGGGLVPGESRSGTVWVLNAGAHASHFSLGVVNIASAPDLADYLQLSAAAPAWNGTARIPPSFGLCTTIVENQTLSAGESVPIKLDLTFSSTAPNSTRNQKSSVKVVFLLQDSDGGAPVSPCAPAQASPSAGASMGSVTVNSDTGAGAGTEVAIVAIPDEAEEQLNSAAPWPEGARAQSNVVATVRSPWPWVTLLSAGTYMAISLSRQKSQRRTP